MSAHDDPIGAGEAAAPVLRKLGDRAWRDVKAAYAQRRFWSHMAAQDLSMRYARSVLGPFWLTLTMALQIIALTYLATGLFAAPLRVAAPWITIGVIAWTFISSVLNESAYVLILNRAYFLEAPTSVIGFVLIVVLRNALITSHHLIILAATLAVLGAWPQLSWLWLLAGLPVLLAAVTGLGLTLAVLTPRFRDLAPLTFSVMMIGFFLTPVLWRPDSLIRNEFIATYNPFTHLLAVIREPILGSAPDGLSWLVSSLTAGASLTCGLMLLALFRPRIVYWV